MNEHPVPPEPALAKLPSEAAKTQFELEKLELEVAKLRREASLSGRIAALVLPMFVSTVTAFVAILGIGISVWTLAQQRTSQETDSHNKALQTALDMATDNKGQADRRISGINQLRRFWANQADEQVVAATLSAILILPDSVVDAAPARCAAAEAIGAAYGINGAGTGVDRARADRIAQLLYGNSEGNWGLVSHENYLLRRALDRDSNPTRVADIRKNDSLAVNLACDTPLGATREAIRKNWEYLRGVNLQYTDLSYALLYEADLSGALLMGAYLSNTMFRCANLSGADLMQYDIGNSPDLYLANVRGVVSNGLFFDYAKGHGVVAPESPDRE
jgi:Pentapeptide repeats (8 copies)